MVKTQQFVKDEHRIFLNWSEKPDSTHRFLRNGKEFEKILEGNDIKLIEILQQENIYGQYHRVLCQKNDEKDFFYETIDEFEETKLVLFFNKPIGQLTPGDQYRHPISGLQYKCFKYGRLIWHFVPIDLIDNLIHMDST